MIRHDDSSRAQRTVCSEDLGRKLKADLRINEQQDLILAVIVILEVLNTIALDGVGYPHGSPLADSIVYGYDGQRLLLVEDPHHIRPVTVSTAKINDSPSLCELVDDG